MLILPFIMKFKSKHPDPNYKWRDGFNLLLVLIVQYKFQYVLQWQDPIYQFFIDHKSLISLQLQTFAQK
jgi:hypothetical protein